MDKNYDMQVMANEFDGLGYLPLKTDDVNPYDIEYDVREAAHEMGLFANPNDPPYQDDDFHVKCLLTEKIIRHFVLDLFNCVVDNNSVLEKYETLRGYDLELVDYLFDLVQKNGLIPRHSVEVCATLYGIGKDNDDRKDIMRRLLISVQSMSDVITNSSSELYVISKANTTKRALQKMLDRGMPGDGTSGMGGDAYLCTFDVYRLTAFWLASVIPAVTMKEEISMFREWQVETDWSDATKETFERQDKEIHEVVSKYFTEDQVKRIEILFKKFYGIDPENEVFIVDIDWNAKATIDYLKKNYGAVLCGDA